jgi:pimeloyl-ACP methyl ester carboxylesterase
MSRSSKPGKRCISSAWYEDRYAPHSFHAQPQARGQWAVTPEQWSAIKAPTLALWTDHDPTATVKTGREQADAIPGAKFVVM